MERLIISIRIAFRPLAGNEVVSKPQTLKQASRPSAQEEVTPKASPAAAVTNDVTPADIPAAPKRDETPIKNANFERQVSIS